MPARAPPQVGPRSPDGDVSARNAPTTGSPPHCRERSRIPLRSNGLQISRARLRGEPRRIAFPDDAGVLEHVDAIGMWQREGHVLLAEQHGDRRGLAQTLERLRDLLEDDGGEAEG